MRECDQHNHEQQDRRNNRRLGHKKKVENTLKTCARTPCSLLTKSPALAPSENSGFTQSSTSRPCLYYKSFHSPLSTIGLPARMRDGGRKLSRQHICSNVISTASPRAQRTSKQSPCASGPTWHSRLSMGYDHSPVSSNVTNKYTTAVKTIPAEIDGTVCTFQLQLFFRVGFFILIVSFFAHRARLAGDQTNC